jgi:hypothetical protein
MHLEILAGNGYGIDTDVEQFKYTENGLVIEYETGSEECYPDAEVWAAAEELEELDEDLVPYAEKYR